ncbi:hypothetical protein M758_UG321000 [Ceratodon purpureus]|nr:hypothetical protein M758_UG321000 [Ceratodon purpureus]
MASSLSECGSCSVNFDYEGYISDCEEIGSGVKHRDSRLCFQLLRDSVMASVIPTSGSVPPQTTPVKTFQSVLGRAAPRLGSQQLSQHASRSEEAPLGWPPEQLQQPSTKLSGLPHSVTPSYRGSSPFQRRIPHIASRPAHIAPPSMINHSETSPGGAPYVQRGQRRPRSPATKKREAMAKRRAQNLQNEAYALQRIAHAEGRQIRYPILTNREGEIIGNRGKWQAAVRSIVELTVDRSIREYRKEPGEWKWLLRTIQRELDLWFSFGYPVKPEILSSYLSQILSNDRYKWHKHYIQTEGGQHEDCSDEAFQALRQFWESPEGKAKSENMSRIRSKVGKGVGFFSEQDPQQTPTHTWRSKSVSNDLHTPRPDQVKVLKYNALFGFCQSMNF